MYERNAVAPAEIVIGEVRLVADNTLQTAGVLVSVIPSGEAEAAGLGTLRYLATSGQWAYTPTQSETDYESFAVAIYKANCYGRAVGIFTDEVRYEAQVAISLDHETSTLRITAWLERNGVMQESLASCRLVITDRDGTDVLDDLKITTVLGHTGIFAWEAVVALDPDESYSAVVTIVDVNAVAHVSASAVLTWN